MAPAVRRPTSALWTGAAPPKVVCAIAEPAASPRPVSRWSGQPALTAHAADRRTLVALSSGPARRASDRSRRLVLNRQGGGGVTCRAATASDEAARMSRRLSDLVSSRNGRSDLGGFSTAPVGDRGAAHPVHLAYADELAAMVPRAGWPALSGLRERRPPPCPGWYWREVASRRCRSCASAPRARVARDRPPTRARTGWRSPARGSRLVFRQGVRSGRLHARPLHVDYLRARSGRGRPRCVVPADGAAVAACRSCRCRAPLRGATVGLDRMQVAGRARNVLPTPRGYVLDRRRTPRYASWLAPTVLVADPLAPLSPARRRFQQRGGSGSRDTTTTNGSPAS